MTHSQHIGDSSSSNQQIQAPGDVNAQISQNGGVSIGGCNYGIVITSAQPPTEPQHTFDIAKNTRIPAPASVIAIVSGLITIVGFVTGIASMKQLFSTLTSNTDTSILHGPPEEYYWLIVSMLIVIAGCAGFAFFRFLLKNVLRLPKRWFFRAWAGIKEESGRIYPYSLRLKMRCPECKNTKLRFKQAPAKWQDFYNTKTGGHIKRIVTERAPMAVCPRNEEHSIPVDISGNDFDDALPR